MTVEETSNKLDTALARYDAGITVDEYTKSLYLTTAQYAFVRAVLGRYEKGESVRHLIRPLIVEENITNIPTGSPVDVPIDNKKFLQVLYEKVNKSVPVIPMDLNDVHFTLHNPFRLPNKDIAYRVTMDGIFRLYCYEQVTNYQYTMCLNPEPIILLDLTGTGLEIGGVSVSTESVLVDDAVDDIIKMAARDIIADKAKFSPRQTTTGQPVQNSN